MKALIVANLNNQATWLISYNCQDSKVILLNLFIVSVSGWTIIFITSDDTVCIIFGTCIHFDYKDRCIPPRIDYRITWYDMIGARCTIENVQSSRSVIFNERWLYLETERSLVPWVVCLSWKNSTKKQLLRMQPIEAIIDQYSYSHQMIR